MKGFGFGFVSGKHWHLGFIPAPSPHANSTIVGWGPELLKIITQVQRREKL